MEYTSNRDFVNDEMFSGLAPPPDMIQDTWIGGTVTESLENDSSNGEYLHYINMDDPSSYGETGHPDLLLGSDDEIDKVVHQLFQRERTDSNESLPVPETTRTPSPPQDGFFEGRTIVEEDLCTTSAVNTNVDFSNNKNLLNIEQVLRGCETVDGNGNIYQVSSPPNEKNQVCLSTHEVYKEEPYSLFSGNGLTGGTNIGYVATTFAPVPISTSGDIPSPFGFYSSISLPRDSVINAASFVTRLSSLQPGRAAGGRVRGNNEQVPMSRQNAYGFTPRAMSSPKSATGAPTPLIQEGTQQFYQPTIRRNRPASIEERSPLIAALLKSQTSIFTQPPVQRLKPKPPILFDSSVASPPENMSDPNGIVQTSECSTVATKPPRQRKQVFLTEPRDEHPMMLEPTIITLDDTDEKEDLQVLEDPGSAYSYIPSYKTTPAKNPSVLVFPNMRDFSVGDPTIFKTRRFSLCDQAKTIVGRVLAYNKEVRKRMGSGYVGPWLSPVKLTSNMTGISTAVVKQCEEYSTRVLTRCTLQLKDSRKIFPAERYQIMRPVSVVPTAIPISMKVKPPLVEEVETTASAVSVVSKSATPPPKSAEFDWSSLYNGQPPKNDQRRLVRKRSLPATDMAQDGIPHEKRLRGHSESLGEGGFDDDETVISNLLTELVDKISGDISSGSTHAKQRITYRTLKEVLSDSDEMPKNRGLGSGIIRRSLVRCAQTKRSVPVSFDGNWNSQRSYNFRPRESIVKKRFFD